MLVVYTGEHKMTRPTFNKRAFNAAHAGAIGLSGLTLAGVLALDNVVDDVGDVVKQKYVAQSKPAWDAAGQAELMGNYGSLYRSTRAKEMMYNMMFDTPETVLQSSGKTLGESLVRNAMGAPAGLDSTKLVASLASSPEVRAVGKARARGLMKEVVALAPNITAAAPSIALPILQTAIDSGSMSLRPEMLKTLIDSENKYNKQFGK